MEFDPRRAEPGQEFGYTGTDRQELADGDELPEGARLEVETDFDVDATADGPKTEAKVRRFAVREGVQKTLKADSEGVVRPKTQEEATLLDSFDLPVARTAKAEAKAEEKAAKPSEAPKE